MAQRVISHHTVNGQIESQAYQGFTQAVLTDALGSVVRTSSNPVDLRYTPYGSALGTGYWVQSLFTWVGSFGYRVTNAKYIESYVRARHYSAKSGAWTTIDPLWPEELAYGYVAQGPVTLVDFSGLASCQTKVGDPCNPKAIADCIDKCKYIRMNFKSCVLAGISRIRQGNVELEVLDFDCRCKCPDHIQSSNTALNLGVSKLHSKFGKCKIAKKGLQTPANSCLPNLGGTHQTWTYMCGNKMATVSVLCCRCPDKPGSNCYPIIKP